jgi:carboxyl-terminal processing protease
MDAAGRPRDVSIPFSQAQAPLEWHQVVAGDVGVIRLDALAIADPAQPGGFDAIVVAERVAAVLGEFERQGVRGWVLDLRASTGGDMRALLNLLVADGRLFGILGRGPTAPAYEEATGRVLPFQQPLMVLVSGATISGSEVFAAVLQAVGRATVIGEQTPGSFTAQQPERLGDGSVFALSVGEVVVGPNDARLNGKGVTPNLVVPGPTPEQDAAGRDPQLEAAVRFLQAQRSSR